MPPPIAGSGAALTGADPLSHMSLEAARGDDQAGLFSSSSSSSFAIASSMVLKSEPAGTPKLPRQVVVGLLAGAVKMATWVTPMLSSGEDQPPIGPVVDLGVAGRHVPLGD